MLNSPRKSLSRGALLRFPASHPFEDLVVMMVCESPQDPLQMALMTISGHKAGINCFQILPRASLQKEGVSTDWLVHNWKKWVWPDGHAKDVEVREGLDALEL